MNLEDIPEIIRNPRGVTGATRTVRRDIRRNSEHLVINPNVSDQQFINFSLAKRIAFYQLLQKFINVFKQNILKLILPLGESPARNITLERFEMVLEKGPKRGYIHIDGIVIFNSEGGRIKLDLGRIHALFNLIMEGMVVNAYIHSRFVNDSVFYANLYSAKDIEFNQAIRLA